MREWASKDKERRTTQKKCAEQISERSIRVEDENEKKKYAEKPTNIK